MSRDFRSGSITDVPGFRVGHVTYEDAGTGCTVILCPPETTGGGEALGGWPSTREMGILSPLNASPHIHAISFSGGSTYGLAAAEGVVRWIDEQHGVLPQVPGAIINDLWVGDGNVRPGVDDGYLACERADTHFERGSVGAGTGATVGKGRGDHAWMKGGIGSASRTFGEGGVVGALAVVNAVGDVLDRDGKILAGAHDAEGRPVDYGDLVAGKPDYSNDDVVMSTTLVAVATNARLSKTECSIVAHMAQAGLPRAISPIYTPWDGDTLVVAASGEVEATAFAVGVMAAEIVAESIRDGVIQATSLGGVPDRSTPGIRDMDHPAWSK